MNAKTELAHRICTTFPVSTPITVEAVTAILKDYIIIKDSDEQRSDLTGESSIISVQNALTGCRKGP